jgi:hypothetical protein
MKYTYAIQTITGHIVASGFETRALAFQWLQKQYPSYNEQPADWLRSSFAVKANDPVLPIAMKLLRVVED